MRINVEPKEIGVHNMAKVVRLAIMLDKWKLVELKLRSGCLLRLMRDEEDGYELKGRLYSPNYSNWSDEIRFNILVTKGGLELHQFDAPWSLITWGELEDVRDVGRA